MKTRFVPFCAGPVAHIVCLSQYRTVCDGVHSRAFSQKNGLYFVFEEGRSSLRHPTDVSAAAGVGGRRPDGRAESDFVISNDSNP
jgi:hypothetical protein